MQAPGWDSVFVAEIPVLNRALAAFSQAEGAVLDAKIQDVRVTARLGIWSIVQGGDGEYVFLQIALDSGTLDAGSGAAIALDGAKVVLKTRLTFLPAPSGQGRDLRFDLTSAGGADGSITPVSVAPGKAPLSAFQQTMIGMAVAQDLVANAAKLSFVLAHIEPMANSGVSWLQPRQCAYAYVSEVGTGRQLMAIFAVSDDRPIEHLSTQLDPSLLSNAATVGLAISGDLFLQHVFAPAFAKSLNTSAANTTLTTAAGLFAAIDRAEAVVNPKAKAMLAAALGSRAAAGGPGVLHLRKPVTLKGIKSGLITYYPVVHAASATINDDEIHTSLSGTCDLGLGISMTFSSSSVVTAAFEVATQTLSFGLKGHPAFSHDVHIPWYDHLFDLAGLLAEAILQAVTAAVGSGLASGINSVISSDAVARTAISVVKWSGVSAFTPTAGGLATMFYIQGKS
ncbi:TULIP family P47-like protein [Desertibaculum subflavum]|uniref:TULIP family P47-like protein n=1 Tax=Desertibaculum subflavum TaxID=2268458 RepID=UPI000E66473F